MGLNEISNQEAEKQLEDAGYEVYNRTELKTMDINCGENEKIKCVKEWLDDNGISSSDYRTAKYRGLCYIAVRSPSTVTHTVGSDNKKIKKKTWSFWDNGDITFIYSFVVVQSGATDTTIKYSQVQFKGKYECDGTELKYENLKYQGVYKFGDTSSLIRSVPKNYMTKNADGTNKVELGNYATTNATMVTSDFN
jgi:hypothetical protein